MQAWKGPGNCNAKHSPHLDQNAGDIASTVARRRGIKGEKRNHHALMKHQDSKRT